MAWKNIYKLYRNFAFVFHLVVFVIIFMAILPVATRGVTVENIGDAEWSYDGENVLIAFPVTIKNGGFYSINDIVVRFKVDNSSANFVKSKQDLGDIGVGTTKTVKVVIPVNLEHLYELESPSFYHFYNHDTFSIKFHLSLKYMFNLVNFDTSYDGDIHWEPIVKEFEMHHPSVIQEETYFKVIIPYTVETASYLTGRARFSGMVNGENFEGNFTTEFPLGRKYDGHIVLEFDNSASRSLLTHSQNLHLRGNVSFRNFSMPMERDYYWGAPLNNLRVSVLSNGTLHYTFQNDADFSMNLQVERDYYNGSTLVYHEEETLTVNSGDEVDRYEEINVTQPVDRVVITFSDRDNGIYYQEVLTP